MKTGIQLTVRERWRAALRLEPVDRLPFWPKLGGSYARAQAAPFRDMTGPQFHEWIGSDPHVWVGAGVKEVRRRTSVETTRDGNELRTVYRAPGGACELVQQYDQASDAWHPVRFPVRTREDIGLMTEIYADVSVEPDPDGLAKAREEERRIGEGALVAGGIGESALMHWVEFLAGIENAHYLLADCPDEVAGLFAAMHAVLRRRAELMAGPHPGDALYMVENTSTTLISPGQYRAWCLPHLREYAEIVRAAGSLMILHMCGHLKQLLPDLATLPVAAFEAFTSPTLGNTTLLDGRRACPNVCLIGGTNAPLWLRPADEIVARVAHDLDALPHHRGIVVTSAGVMPPGCPPGVIRDVCRRVQDYPARA